MEVNVLADSIIYIFLVAVKKGNIFGRGCVFN